MTKSLTHELRQILGRLEAAGDDVASVPTLSQFFSDHMAGLKSAEVDGQYHSAITHFENRVRVCEDHGLVIVPLRKQKPNAGVRPVDRRCPKCPASSRRSTSIASAAQISATVIDGWRCIMARDGFSPATCNRFIDQIRSVLWAMHEADLHVKPPRRVTKSEVRKSIRTVPDAELLACYRSAGAATWKPAAWWQCLLVLIATYGFRPSTATTLLWRGVEHYQPREGVYFGRKAPHAELQQAGITFANGWLVVLPSKERQHKPDPIVLPLSKAARRELWRARQWKQDGGPVLPVLDDEIVTYKAKEHAFRSDFARIQQSAQCGGWTLKHLRKNCETRYARQFTPDDARFVTGHADRSISGRHYLDMTVRIIDQIDRFELSQLLEHV